MQRYFTLQLFECFDIPIDDLWAEIDVPDGMRMRRRMHSFFCRHSILRITYTNTYEYGLLIVNIVGYFTCLSSFSFVICYYLLICDLATLGRVLSLNFYE